MLAGNQAGVFMKLKHTVCESPNGNRQGSWSCSRKGSRALQEQLVAGQRQGEPAAGPVLDHVQVGDPQVQRELGGLRRPENHEHHAVHPAGHLVAAGLPEAPRWQGSS